jgi:hypothetical protein
MGASSFLAALRGPAAFILTCVLGGCTGSAKREGAALTDAVDRYRRAESSAKAAQGQAAFAVTCSDAEVCAAKQACLAAIDPTTRALSLKDEVAARVVDIQAKRLAPDAPEADALPGKLDQAELLLREGRAKMAVCDAKLGALVK